MSGRNSGPPMPMKNMPHQHGRIPLPPHEPPPYGRNMGLMPHPALLEEMRERESQFGMGPPRSLPPHPAILEDRLGVQLQEIQGLLVDNQRVAATHVALKQELEAAHFELKRMTHYADSFHAEKDMQMKEMFDRSGKLEMDLQAADAMKGELTRVQSDIKELTVVRQELMAQVQGMNQDLGRASADIQQVPALKAEIEHMRQEVDRAKAAIEYEKKVYADSYEQGQAMQSNLLSMARELEKLRAEVANAEKRARAAAAVGNPAAGYNGNYSAPEAGYAGNPYPAAGYGVNPTQTGMENYPQYGPGPGNWGAYNMQRSQGHR
ncbi:protein FLX-like 1 isoform X2 [Beta vulgaris subsp. vulgaris]|uniref:protein FLX-like 1 isoform X2 n=1 Tax=Beta vulgaris subsp. vulgaris TaxID=3555 RepID=UPI00203693E2|nr:protein FLX-like 1 isoform X2 [Beta vulgaris subsp. vulgaris]